MTIFAVLKMNDILRKILIDINNFFSTRFNVEEEDEETGDVELDTTAQRLHRWELEIFAPSK